MAEVDYYAVLGVERAATDDEVKAAYRRAVKAAHPDHGGTEGLFGLVQEAGEHLLDPGARASYDSGGHALVRHEDRTPVVADPWGEDWNDAAPVHSPTRPPAFANPWWEHPTETTPAIESRGRRARRGPRDQWQAVAAPPPFEVRIAQALLVAFVAAFVALRVFAASPRPALAIDLLGLAWVTLPVLGVVAAARALVRIRQEPMRFGSARTVVAWLVVNLVAAIAVIGGGVLVLRTSL